MIAAMSSTNRISALHNSKFCIGIDLGTSNSALAYFDREKQSQPIQIFRIPQVGKHGHEEFLPLLPSSIFLEEDGQRLVGTQALALGSKVPTRCVLSAKSWLCNVSANRKEKVLPFEVADASIRLSAVQASSLFLLHIREMWNRQMAKNKPDLALEEQEIVLTVPASFDELARALTVEAATIAGFKHLTLLEEPQAAFYNRLLEYGTEGFVEGDSILVCDVGGGTTDFSLIHVVENLELRRMAVGKHLLLGGDNMDYALKAILEARAAQHLDTNQQHMLLSEARLAKEAFFNDPKKEFHSVFITGSGSKVVGGSLNLSLSRKEVEETLVEGFFGIYPFEEAIELKKGSAVRQMGLAYETEASITKQLAHFLYKNKCATKPTYVLFNGGSLKPVVFQKRIVESLDLWFKDQKPVQILPSSSLDLAVAKGAAYYAKVRGQPDYVIKGGTPRSYYLEIEMGGEKKALTLLPRGTNEGTKLVSEKVFSLTANQPVVFQLLHSHTRLNDQAGDLIPIVEEEMTRLSPIHTRCQYGKKEQKEQIEVQLEITLTPIGILELALVAKNTPHKWKLEFQVQGDIQEKRLFDAMVDEGSLKLASQELQEAFSVGSQNKLVSVMGNLESVLKTEKNQFPPSILRALFETLLSQASKRHLAAHYEVRFWNLAGFFLRPGMGYPMDEFRIKQLWKLILEDLKRPKSEEVQLQQWICYRRISAGLSKGCQIQLYNELNSYKLKKKGYAYAEHLRALASLELIDIPAKIKMGNNLLKKIVSGDGENCDYWALGRVGSRELFHGSAANVIPAKTCEEWILTLLDKPQAQNPQLPFTLALLARKTGCPQIDLSQQLIAKIAPHMADLQDLIITERPLTHQEQDRFFGDALPPGLSLSVGG